ncbi:MAG: hypothetical protein HY472_00205 [Candidatus Sungbacteria bacterium]|nr:hypothetical protein [Candidatus Sungbacteria bacterium]
MRQSQLFGKTLREDPKDEVSQNAKLLERGGFVHKTMAGVYDYLPLGLRVLAKVKQIIREEMDAIGGQEAFLTVLQPRERWEKGGRWKALEEAMYQFKDHSGREIGLAFTHEEAFAEIALRSIQSYKDLPVFVYQIQTKFRAELRAKSGLLRGREFLMKDLYSFHTDADDLNRFYFGPIDKAYRKIFKRCGFDVYFTEASGGVFTAEFTHEYQQFSPAGEDTVFYCMGCRFAQNSEIATIREGDSCPKCGERIQMTKSIELGNIFRLGTRYSEPMGLFYADKKGERKPVVMGSYGIGLGRLIAAAVEIHHDDRGIVWPESIAPYHVHLIELGDSGRVYPHTTASGVGVKRTAELLYKTLAAKGIEALYDDRDDKTPGEKFADADLIGIPWRVVVSERTVSKKSAELKKRSAAKGILVSASALVNKLAVKS